MPNDDDWVPARRVAKRFFSQIGVMSRNDKGPLWDGKTVVSTSPANLLHEVAHFQIAPDWRRFKPGYGLGVEPEGSCRPPQLVPDLRTEIEEGLASTLGILWEAHLGYPGWNDTARSHGWGEARDDEDFKDVAEFLKAAREQSRKLLRLGLITAEGVPRPVLAKRWRAREGPQVD
jgi:hypothetical protein